MTRRACSIAPALRKRIPARAPRPVPTRIAVGVARPSAQGQAMMRTDANATVAKSARGSGPTTYQTTQVATAIARTTGTKTPEMRSASFWIGGLEACACSTSRAICASAVRLPTAVASMSIAPSTLRVPPMTRSPGPFSTGSDSPVTIDSSTDARPARTLPSTGIASPGLTRSRSPTATSARGTSRSTPSRTRRAIRGARSSSWRTAADVLLRARVSR